MEAGNPRRASETDRDYDAATFTLSAIGYGYGYGYGYGRRLEREFARIELEIITAADKGQIRSIEECRLLDQLVEIDRRYDGLRSKGLGCRERRAIIQRLRLIRSEIYELCHSRGDKVRDDLAYLARGK